MSIVVFEEITLSVIESSDHGSLLSSKDTALGYGCSEATIRNNLKNHKDELIEGKHFIIDRSYKNTPKTMWTLEGVYMLGFFIKSEQAKTFRMYVSKLLTELRNGNATVIGQEQYTLLKETVIQQNAQIAQLTIELKSKPKRLPPPSIDNTLKQTLIKVHDGYHRILITCSPIDMIKELSGMTCLFQLIGSTLGDGKNLNTQTKAGHAYWGDINKIQRPKLLK